MTGRNGDCSLAGKEKGKDWSWRVSDCLKLGSRWKRIVPLDVTIDQNAFNVGFCACLFSAGETSFTFPSDIISTVAYMQNNSDVIIGISTFTLAHCCIRSQLLG